MKYWQVELDAEAMPLLLIAVINWVMGNGIDII
jgi:hypothetical protein